MKTKTQFAISLFAAMMLASTVNVHGQKKKSSSVARVELLSDQWEINTPTASRGQLTSSLSTDSMSAPEDIEKGFTIRFNVHLIVPTFDRPILEIPEVLTVRLRQHNPLDRDRQNYPAYKMPDGTVPVLEAELELKSPVDGRMERMTIGVPLAMLPRPWGDHEVILNFSGACWTMFVDGRLVDNEFPLGYPLTEKMKQWKIDTNFVAHADFHYPSARPERTTKTGKTPRPQIQYWTPTGHNAWVGDVVSLFHDGRYHLFYLYDRCGHGSKFGRGGHYFEHLSTTDFRHWTEHEAAVPIEEQWETFGTGTPFVYNNQLCLSYGYHTTRIYPREKTTLPAMYQYLERHGHTGSFNKSQLSGVPAGSSYSVSDDGVHFLKTGILFHPCENPSIFTDPQGKLKMLANYGARGTWASDSINGGWRCLNEDFPSGGDCTFFFNWGEHDYIIGGFTNLWSKLTAEPDTAYQDVVAQGMDFYNGSCVPTITPIPGDRYIMAGWMWMKAWGGPLVIHEMTRMPDGRIGTKWMEELMPATTGKSMKLSADSSKPITVPTRSFLLTFDVTPTAPDGKVAVGLFPSSDKGTQDACEWQFDGDAKRAQYARALTTEYSPRQRSLREGGAPQSGRDYAVENLLDTDRSFTVRMIVKGSDKFDGCLVDTEIAGKRTMISYREKLTVDRLRFSKSNVEIKNIRLTPLAD